MRLEVGTFPVNDVTLGAHTRWDDGVLEVNLDEIMSLVREDSRIERADIALAKPGEKVRIVGVHDVVEPKIKVEGSGVAYPAVCGRSVETVGRGRTHRLAGLTVMECVDTSKLPSDSVGVRAYRAPWNDHIDNFIDMSGPGVVQPFSEVNNLCVVMEPPEGFDIEEWDTILHSAALRVSDRLAQTTIGLDPPETEVFDFTPEPGLPGVVFVPQMFSSEIFLGPHTQVGVGVYGICRVSAPWVLSPTEMMDGAVFGRGTYLHANNPVVDLLSRAHGKDINFRGVIVNRTNWSSQIEKQVAANRVAELAITLGAEGAIITTDVRGQRMVETMLTLQACERAGLKTVFLSQEEDNEDGSARPFLTHVPEMVAVVSSGTGGAEGPFPPVDRVIGLFENDQQFYGELPSVNGCYGADHLLDIYGYGRQSCADY